MTIAKMTDATSNQDGPDKKPTENAQSPEHNTLNRFAQEIRAQLFSNDGYLKLNYFTMFWIFIAGAMFGLTLETIYHAIFFGGFESRAGLLWGPFSPIYGAGAVLLTLFLNRFHHSHNLVIFLIAMVVGSFIEYVTSWGMEYFWGAVAWNYSGTFGSINGRTNFLFGIMWGMLGLVWVRFIMPLMKRVFSHINSNNTIVRIVTMLLSIVMALNIIFTCTALYRQSERASGIPASNPIESFFDTAFPDSYLETRFENMTVGGKK